MMKPPKGLKITQLRPGTGAVAEFGKFAIIRYDCYLPQGEKCDSSETKGSPSQLKVGERRLVPAIAYTVPGMLVGEIRRVRAAPNLTYYERKRNLELPPTATLTYEIELISVSDNWTFQESA